MCYNYIIYFHLPDKFRYLSIELTFSSCIDSSSSKSSSKLSNASGRGRLFHLTSGIPLGDKTTDIILSTNLYFNIRSFTVVDVSDGEALT